MKTKGYKGIGMEGFIARSYDKNSGTSRIKEMGKWAQYIQKHVKAGGSVLEVAPGPGYLSIELKKLGNYKITGLDISNTFVEIAKGNAKAAGVEIEFKQGNASDMPFEDRTFDFIMCTAAFKNFSEPVNALKEMYRVLRPGGKAWINDMRFDISGKTINDYVHNEMKEKGLSALFMKFTFKYFLKKRAYTREQFTAFISKTSFKKYKITEESIGFEILLEK